MLMIFFYLVGCRDFIFFNSNLKINAIDVIKTMSELDRKRIYYSDEKNNKKQITATHNNDNDKDIGKICYI